MRKTGTVTRACVQMFAASGIAIVFACVLSHFFAKGQRLIDG